MDRYETNSFYNLAIACRIYPRVSKVPFIYPDDKFSLVKAGLKSLKESLGTLQARIFFILDDCPPEYEDMILAYFDHQHIEFIKLKGEGNLATFGRQIDLLLNQNYSDIIFFAEDDYIYRPMLLQSAVSMLRENADVDFVTPYDHLDSYTLPIHTKHTYQITIHDGLHWRTSASTCLTFLTSKKALAQSQKTFKSYCHGNWDSSLWFALTKFNIFNFIAAFGYFFSDRFLFKTIALSWIKSWRQILFGKKFKLWQPIPSIATHMEAIALAPNINWRPLSAANETVTLPKE